MELPIPCNRLRFLPSDRQPRRGCSVWDQFLSARGRFWGRGAIVVCAPSQGAISRGSSNAPPVNFQATDELRIMRAKPSWKSCRSSSRRQWAPIAARSNRRLPNHAFEAESANRATERHLRREPTRRARKSLRVRCHLSGGNAPFPSPHPCLWGTWMAVFLFVAGAGPIWAAERIPPG